MELHQLIGNTLQEIQRAKEYYEDKSKYLIDEINLEINVSEFQSVNGGLQIMVFNGGGEVNNTKTHTVNIKLKPKRAGRPPRDNSQVGG